MLSETTVEGCIACTFSNHILQYSRVYTEDNYSKFKVLTQTFRFGWIDRTRFGTSFLTINCFSSFIYILHGITIVSPVQNSSLFTYTITHVRLLPYTVFISVTTVVDHWRNTNKWFEIDILDFWNSNWLRVTNRRWSGKENVWE